MLNLFVDKQTCWHPDLKQHSQLEHRLTGGCCAMLCIYTNKIKQGPRAWKASLHLKDLGRPRLSIGHQVDSENCCASRHIEDPLFAERPFQLLTSCGCQAASPSHIPRVSVHRHSGKEAASDQLCALPRAVPCHAKWQSSAPSLTLTTGKKTEPKSCLEVGYPKILPLPQYQICRWSPPSAGHVPPGLATSKPSAIDEHLAMKLVVTLPAS